MNKELATEILAYHADQLVAGVDVTEKLSRQYPDLLPMLEVAQATYQQLKPVATPESIHRAMYAQLGRVATKQTHSQQPLWRRTGTAVGIGSVVTGIALVVATRRLRTS